jgi:hypothetical protein
MSRWNEREIARKLAERDKIEPPAGLLEKIKGEIPPTIPVGLPRAETRRAVPPPQRWLIAASLAAMVGAGFFALHLRMEPPRAAFAHRPAAEGKADAVRVGQASRPVPSPAEQPLGEPGGSERALQAPPPPPAVPKPLSRKDRKEIQALDDAAPQDGVAGGVEGGVPGGVAGGTVAAAPAPVAPPPAAPTQAAAVPPAAKAEAKPEAERDKITVTAESPLLDERRISTGATVSQAELEKIPTATKSSPGTATGRISVGGNESGQQSDSVGPGSPFADAAAHPVSTFRLAAGKPSDAVSIRFDAPVVYFDFDAFEEMPEPAAVAVTAEGAPTPFVHGPRFRLLCFHLGGVPMGAPVEVSFNPAVVARYRLVGASATGLYEIELRPDAPRAGRVATLRLIDPPGTTREVALSDFARSWKKASPSFRLAALAARFGEILGGSPGTRKELDEIARQVRKAGRELPASSGAAELADQVEKAERPRS